ncbi:MAG: YdcF family protein [Nitrospirae bacterium]|nr:YdcF family protein [Nitrospirota bacterium]
MFTDRERKPKGRFLKRLVFVIVLLAVLYVYHESILNYMASQLVYSDPLPTVVGSDPLPTVVGKDDIKPIDAIVVLTGDYTGERLMTAIDLLKKGYGKYIVFWGGPIYWKVTIAELYLRQLQESGVQPERAVWSDERLTQLSTTAEAQVNMRLLKGRGARSFILVTSDYHTARARNVYKDIARNNGMTMFVYPAPDSTVKLQGWWRDRSSAKVVFIELQKTVWYRLFQ